MKIQTKSDSELCLDLIAFLLDQEPDPTPESFIGQLLNSLVQSEEEYESNTIKDLG